MNEKIDIDVKTLRPFTRFIYTIGELPTSYLMSMTYEEQLIWLCNYLTQTVIPTINNNGEAVKEVQNIVMELQEYINNYFDNLDVQEEINNKLDDMAESGEFQNLLSEYFTDLENSYNTRINNLENDYDERFNNLDNNLNEYENTINNDINNIRNIVNNVSSGSPLVASSIDDMTDTTRIYVNTTDGKWYYYDGDSWEIGGTYQSSGISNKSIDILMFDDDLQSNFFMEFSTPIDHGNAYEGYYKNDGTLDTSGTTYVNYHVALENGETYVFTGQNVSLLACLVIKDNSNNIIYASNPNGTTGYFSTMFKVKENNLTAYISIIGSPSNNNFEQNYLIGMLRKLNGLYNQLKYTNVINPILSIEGKFIQAGNFATSTVIRQSSSTDALTEIYQMSKGRSYNINAINFSNVCAITIIDLNKDIIYISSDENIGNNDVAVTKNFTADKDGYIILSTFNPSTKPYSIAIVDNDIILNNYADLYGKTISCDGDSIMRGNENSQISYYDLIITKLGMTQQTKNAVGGSTIATGTQSGGTDRHWISSGVLDINTNSDYILINGGVNDYYNKVNLGEITETFTDNIDSTTFAGGMELLCRNLLNRFTNGQKILFVFNHNINGIWYTNNEVNGHDFEDYYNIQVAVLKKYGIPYLDLIHESQLNTILDTYKNNYTVGDGVHPNTLGYNKFYVDKIISKLKSL